MLCSKELTLLWLVAATAMAGCQTTPKAPGPSPYPVPTNTSYDTRMDVKGRYDALSTEITAEDPVYVEYTRDGKTHKVWLMRPFGSQQAARAFIRNSLLYYELLEPATLHVEGDCPVVVTTKIRAVGIGTVMIVEYYGGTSATTESDDIHRVYYLGGAGSTGVDVYCDLPNPGELREIRDKDYYVEFRCVDSTFTQPAPITGARLEFVKRVCKATGHNWPH